MLKFIGTEEDLLKYHWEYKGLNDEDWNLENVWIYEIGHSRRGQFYYYLIDMKTEYKVLLIYASKPDGSGTFTPLDHTIFDMFKNGLFKIIGEESV